MNGLYLEYKKLWKVRKGKRNYRSKLKKEKLKTKKLLKITILGEQEPSVQSADRTKAVQV